MSEEINKVMIKSRGNKWREIERELRIIIGDRDNKWRVIGSRGNKYFLGWIFFLPKTKPNKAKKSCLLILWQIFYELLIHFDEKNRNN